MATPPLAPNSLAWVELGLAALDGLDIPAHAKIRALGLISQHALIDARMAFDERRGKAAAAESGVETDYGVLVRELADPATYPHLTEIVGTEPPPGFAGRRPERRVRLRHRDHPGRPRGAGGALSHVTGRWSGRGRGSAPPRG